MSERNRTLILDKSIVEAFSAGTLGANLINGSEVIDLLPDELTLNEVNFFGSKIVNLTEQRSPSGDSISGGKKAEYLAVRALGLLAADRCDFTTTENCARHLIIRCTGLKRVLGFMELKDRISQGNAV